MLFKLLEKCAYPWPSWLPDWTRILHHVRVGVPQYLLFNYPYPTRYRASCESVPQVDFTLSQSYLPYLSVCGMCFCSVDHVAPEVMPEDVKSVIIPPLWQSRPFITKQGYMGRGPPETIEGDLICIFLGGKTPYVLRPNDSGDYYFIGECCKSHEL